MFVTALHKAACAVANPNNLLHQPTIMQLVPTAYDLESALQEAIDAGLGEQYEEKSTVEVSEEKKTLDLPCEGTPKGGRRNKVS